MFTAVRFLIFLGQQNALNYDSEINSNKTDMKRILSVGIM